MPDPRDWLVVRQDDNGNIYVVTELPTEAEARREAEALEARAHKQMYWCVHRATFAAVR